jgi:hypothetical protein
MRSKKPKLNIALIIVSFFAANYLVLRLFTSMKTVSSAVGAGFLTTLTLGGVYVFLVWAYNRR